MSNRDIALNWQGLPLPVSRQFAVCLTDLLNTHHPTWPQARAVTMNFRDPGYGPESGGLSYGDFWCMGDIEKVAYPAD
ncbi:hypothetical protein [Aeromonas media]|uniref:hypothetical protein n=1 Tax=Aeromonas media TaxID=651 RepID=UPI0038CF68BC